MQPTAQWNCLYDSWINSKFNFIENLCTANLDDLAIAIFAELKTNLSEVALVCKKWQKLADDNRLYRMIFPFNASFSAEDWKKHIGVDAGINSRLPRKAYRDLINEEDFLLTWIPKKVKIFEKESFGKKQILNVELLAKLTLNAKNERTVGYAPYSWEEAIYDEEEQEESHWVLIDRNFKWRNLEPPIEQEAEVVSLRDMSISLLMKYIKSGERCFIVYPPIGQHTFIRVKEKIEHIQILCGFSDEGLFIDNDCNGPDFACLISKKSF